MVRMLINGKPVTAEKGTSVLEIAPPGSKSPRSANRVALAYGACRFCIVEVKRAIRRVTKPPALPVAAAWKSRPISSVYEDRRILIELMLAVPHGGHPRSGARSAWPLPV